MDSWHDDEDDFNAKEVENEDDAYDRHIENTYLKELCNERRNEYEH